MSFIRNSSEKINIEYEIPQKPVISEGDILIKTLLEKQLNKTIHLQDELSYKNQFDKPTELFSETKLLSGQNNLETFQQTAEYLNSIEELKSCGLTDQEIEIYLDYKKGEEYLFLKHKNACRSVLQEKLSYIFEKLKYKTENHLERNSKKLSRHIKEIALSTKPDSVETKLFLFAISCSSNNKVKNSNHPIHELPQLEKDLFGHLNHPKIPSLKKRRKKAKRYLDSDSVDALCRESPIKNKKLETKWDLTEVPFEETKIKEKATKVYSCTPQRNYTIKDNKIVEKKNADGKYESANLMGKPFIVVQSINKHEIYKKLSEEEIKKLARFENYEKGSPTKVLFIKNLAKQVNEEDLIKLFSSFDIENKKTIYRLLRGKMRGQAFVTFNSVDQATKALESVNGIIIKNKPIIIQYGKSA